MDWMEGRVAELRYVIWSNEHRCFWKLPGHGNTWTLSDAGRYSKAEADAILSPDDVILLAPEYVELVATALEGPRG